jgi:hypothetical protein
MSSKYSNGAFVFTRARGLEPRTPEEVVALALKHGLTEADVPPYAGDHEAFVRAIKRVATSVSREGWMLRPIKKGRSSSEALYGIVRETRNESAERLDHEFEARVGWKAEPDPSVVMGDHFVARQVATMFGELRGRLVTDDWGKGIAAVLTRAGAAAVRDDGRVYWCPPQNIDKVRKLGAFLREVGIDLVIAEVEAEAVRVVEQVAQVSLDEELDRLQADADAFNGKQQPGTYERRLEEYQALQRRANLYRDALGLGVEKAESVLGALRMKVEKMLDVRLNTRIGPGGVMREGKCDRSRKQGETPPVPQPEREPALVFSGMRYELYEETPKGDAQWARRYRPAGPTAYDAALLGMLGRPTSISRDMSLRAERVGDRVELVAEGDHPASCVVALRQYGFEIEK